MNTFIPAISNGSPASALPPRKIDPRLTQRGTIIEEASVPVGHKYWRLVEARLFPPGEGEGKAGGRHHAYVEAIDEKGNPVSGVPFTFAWSSGNAPIVSNGKSGFDAANQPFSEGRNAFSVTPGQGGDAVKGIGMGYDDPGGWNAGEHAATLLRYQLAVAGASQTIPPTAPPSGAPTTTQYVAVRDGANLRKEPGDGTVLVTIPYGEEVQTGETRYYKGSSWASATYDDVSGWILMILLDRVKPKPQTPAPTQPAPAGGKLDPLILEAIVLTESGGHGFENGRLKIRVEAHLLLGPTWGNQAAFAPYFRYDHSDILTADYRTDANGAWKPLHASQDSEWEAFTFAMTIDREAALRCASFGAGQIVGFNAKRVGYGSPNAMFNAFQRSEIAQAIAVINYCLADENLMAAIASKDFAGIVRGYNGTGLEKIYTPILVKNYKKIGGS